jgi:hypothetical protein
MRDRSRKPEYISVWILPTDKTRKQFHCIHCGKIAFEYTGDVHGIVAGDNNEEYPQIIECKGIRREQDVFGNDIPIRCHFKYVIS